MLQRGCNSETLCWDTKGCLLFDAISVKCPGRINLQRQEVAEWLLPAIGGERWGVTDDECHVSFQGDENVLKLHL